MAFEQRDNSGILFKNNRKEKDTHPDYDGTCIIDGVEYYMNAWLKDGAKGKFMSFSFKPKQQRAAPKPQRGSRPSPPTQSFANEMDDEIPF